MPAAAPPPNPNLVAIILIVRSREGSRFVFHYPETPQSSQQQDRRKGRKNAYADVASSSSDSDSDSESTSEDEILSARGSLSRKWGGDNDSLASSARRSRQRPDDEEETSSPERGGGDAGTQAHPWDTFFGIRARALAGLLSPTSRSWHKRRFEVGLNDLCFVGWPVFVREDGTWKKKRNKKKKLEGDEVLNSSTEQMDGEEEDPADAPTMAEEIPEKNANMTMFNIVFVLNPPVLEYSLRIKEMYENIVKKFGKALKWEQARCGYVWKESKVILKLKDKARENRSPMSSLYKEILECSSLARAIASIYTSISASKIAGPLVLTPETQLTLQIPPIASISVLPSLTDPPVLPGLWLTTANTVNDEHISSSLHAHSTLYLAKHFALLLLDNEATIIKDVMSSASPLAHQLANYIKASPPTKSFAKVSARASISINDIRQLADHLIYWRRARAIPPLHQRDTYIVSPNADMEKLSSACRAYEAVFPTLPSLPKMLTALSGTPRPYGTLIPSKDHKEAYFQILAWLLRGGWVTQLRTFSWVRVDREIKVAVDKAMKEEHRQEKKLIKEGRDTNSFTGSSNSETSSLHRPSIVSRSFSGSRSSSLADNHSTSGASSIAKHSPSPADLRTSSLILNPIRASPLESAYLTYITNHIIPSPEFSAAHHHHPLSEDELVELQRYFAIFAKEMDGSEAMEKIPIKEGMKRLRAWELLAWMGVGEKVVSVDEVEGEDLGAVEGGGIFGKTKIIVSARHW